MHFLQMKRPLQPPHVAFPKALTSGDANAGKGDLAEQALEALRRREDFLEAKGLSRRDLPLLIANGKVQRKISLMRICTTGHRLLTRQLS